MSFDKNNEQIKYLARYIRDIGINIDDKELLIKSIKNYFVQFDKMCKLLLKDEQSLEKFNDIIYFEILKKTKGFEDFEISNVNNIKTTYRNELKNLIGE